MPIPATSLSKRTVKISAVGLAIVVALAASEMDVRAGARRTFAQKLRYGPGLANHPVQVRPSPAVAIPEGWPLDVSGAITCSTCHHDLPSLEGATEYLLREFDEDTMSITEFCTKCHDAGTRQDALHSHWLAVGVAHIREDIDENARSDGPLDAESRACLGCHDGVSASEHGNSSNDRGMARLGEMGAAHPIGVPYGGRHAQAQSAALRPEALVPTEIRLPGGMVSCVSCHNLYATSPNRLAVPIENSQLCFTCHDMD